MPTAGKFDQRFVKRRPSRHGEKVERLARTNLERSNTVLPFCSMMLYHTTLTASWCENATVLLTFKRQNLGHLPLKSTTSTSWKAKRKLSDGIRPAKRSRPSSPARCCSAASPFVDTLSTWIRVSYQIPSTSCEPTAFCHT